MLWNNKTFQFALLCLLFVIGVVFRTQLAVFFTHSRVGDEIVYLEMAQMIQRDFWVAECCTRGFVYPMFLRVFFEGFGNTDFFPLFFAQAIIDCSIAVILFFTFSKLFPRIVWGSWFVFFVYIFNPLTATYTGMILTETLTFFLMALFLFLLVSSDRISVRFLAGLILGLLMFNRLMFSYWGVFLLVVLSLYHILTRTHFLKRIVPLFLGCFLVVLYPMIANWKIHNTLSPMPYIPGGNYDFLVSMRVHRWPILIEEHQREVEPILVQYYLINFNSREEFLADTGKRIEDVKKEVLANPLPFLWSRLYHIPIFWDKRSFCCYYDPFFPFDSIFIRTGNILFLGLAFIGIIVALREKRKPRETELGVIFICVLLFYLTTALTLRVPEERHTMPAYPVLLLFVPLGVAVMKRRLKQLL